jgi:enamine deaminase RidA (YjgF/YER057c/UK114 family)
LPAPPGRSRRPGNSPPPAAIFVARTGPNRHNHRISGVYGPPGPKTVAGLQEGASTMAKSKIERIGVGPRMSQAVIHGDTVYLAGQVADKLVPSVEKQTQQILASIDRLLKQAGTDKKRILKANIWLSDMRTFDQMNKAWDKWVPKGHAPARATVESRLAGPEYLVEIMVVAAR